MPVAAVQIRIAALASAEAALLRPGAVLAGRVLERRGEHGLLLLAGTPVVAQLPDELAAGVRVRLRVAEVGGERVTLQVVPPETPQAPAAPSGSPVFTLALPGGAVVRLQVTEREPEGGRGGRPRANALTLRYDAPALGPLYLRVAPGAIAVHAADGPPAALASEAADELRTAVERATGAPVQVTVHPRRGMVDVRG